MQRTVFRVCSILATLLAVSACGGGGGGGGDSSSGAGGGSNSSPNSRPTADAGGEYVALAGTTLQASALASADSDGSIVSYRWQQLSGDSVNIASSQSAIAEITVPSTARGEIGLRLTVTDNDGATDQQDTTLYVAARNIEPFLYEGELGLIVRGSDDYPEGTTFEWRQSGGDVVVELIQENQSSVGVRAPLLDETVQITLELVINPPGPGTPAISSTRNVQLLDSPDLESGLIQQAVLDRCPLDTARSAGLQEAREVTSLTCEGSFDLAGLSVFNNLQNLDLREFVYDDFVDLADIPWLQNISYRALNALPCHKIDELVGLFPEKSFTLDEQCRLKQQIDLVPSSSAPDQAVTGAADYESGLLYVPVLESRKIVVVSMDEMRRTDEILLPEKPSAVALSQDRARLYIAFANVSLIGVLTLQDNSLQLVSTADVTSGGINGLTEINTNQLLVLGSQHLIEVDLSGAISNRSIWSGNPSSFEQIFFDVGSQQVYVSDIDRTYIFAADSVDPSATAFRVDQRPLQGVSANEQFLFFYDGIYDRQTSQFASETADGASYILNQGRTQVLQSVRNPPRPALLDAADLNELGLIHTGCAESFDIGFSFNNFEELATLTEGNLCLSKLIQRDNSADRPDLDFDDLGLELCVRNALDGSGLAEPSQLSSLDCSETGNSVEVRDLSGLGRLTGLVELNLSGSKIISVPAFPAHTNIQRLVLRDSDVINLDALVSVDSLQSLDVTGSQWISCSKLSDLGESGVQVTANLCSSQQQLSMPGQVRAHDVDAVSEKLFVALDTVDEVQRIDLATLAVDWSVELTTSPRSLSLSMDGTQLLVGLIDNTIAIYDVMSGQLNRVVSVLDEIGGYPVMIEPFDGNRYLVANSYLAVLDVSNPDTVTRIEPDHRLRSDPIFLNVPAEQKIYAVEPWRIPKAYELDYSAGLPAKGAEIESTSIEGASQLTFDAARELLFTSAGPVLRADDLSTARLFEDGPVVLDADAGYLYGAHDQVAQSLMSRYDAATGVFDVVVPSACAVEASEQFWLINRSNTLPALLVSDRLCISRQIVWP